MKMKRSIPINGITSTPFQLWSLSFPKSRKSRNPRLSVFRTSTSGILPQVLVALLLWASCVSITTSFTSTITTRTTTQRVSAFSFVINGGSVARRQQQQQHQQQPTTTTSTARPVWWFGGTEAEATTTSDKDSCELVAVRIERTSANSRRILGEITVDQCPLEHVWAILTDYNRLAIHVPNLIESRIVQIQTPQATPGDGTFCCRLFQKGAQKIVGFEFGASVTMDMVESILPMLPVSPLTTTVTPTNSNGRSISFTCYDSFFFSQFDGSWKAYEQINPLTGQIDTTLSYVVDVRPKGPVPVAALEWRIREDVPTNLRAVKTAALQRRDRLQRTRLGPADGASYALTPTTATPTVLAANTIRPSRAPLTNTITAAASASADTTLTAYVENSMAYPNGIQSPAFASSSNNKNALQPRTSIFGLTPRQRQAQQGTVSPSSSSSSSSFSTRTVSSFARAATPSPKEMAQRKAQLRQQKQQQTPATTLSKFKVEWDDNETLGAYLKK